jgi:hypothetical protein
VPRGLRPTALALPTACVVTLGVSFAIARPEAEPDDSTGAKPVRVAGEKATFEMPRLGRETKVPALARAPAPEPAPVMRVQQPAAPAPEPLPRRQPRPVHPRLTPAEPVTPAPEAIPPAPTPAAPPPASTPPPPSPPPPARAPEPALSFDDSG